MKIFLFIAFVLSVVTCALAQTGTDAEPVRVLAGGIDLEVQDGGLPTVMGVESIQVMRANRTHPELADNLGWTYNHAPMLAYWQGRFYLQYLSNPFGEHLAPGVTLVATSPDGRSWSTPTQVFPIYFLRPGSISSIESGMAMMHQRMGFYVAPNGRLLVSGHYGHAPDPMGATGIGRVVREAKADGSYGPIYFIRYNSLAKADESNTTTFPFYLRSPDAGFIEACEALLKDRLKTIQWREEDGSEDGFYTVPGKVLQAPSVYHRRDGAAVALFKHGWAALSKDEGLSWSEPVQVPGMITGGAKTWAQRTSDGRYAMVYNPAKLGRWPLAVTTSEDGVVFGDLLLVNGEVPPRRFFGRAKDFGLQYVRGIAEGNGIPPGNDLWITYSSNKEDMWISRIPVPIRHKADRAVQDSFDDLSVDGPVSDWNIYRPRWANVAVTAFPSMQNKSLCLEDQDPYDYAKAVRLFPEAKTVRVSLMVYAAAAGAERLELEILDRKGRRPVRIFLSTDGLLSVANGGIEKAAGTFSKGQWQRIDIQIDATSGKFDFYLDGKVVSQQADFAEPASTVERLSLRTGRFRTAPTRDTHRYGVMEDVPNPDNPANLAKYYFDNVVIN